MWEILRDQVGDEDACEQAGDIQWQLESKLCEPFVQEDPEDSADVDGKDGVKKVQARSSRPHRAMP